MHRLRQLISVSSTGAALALGTAMALVIVSCSTSPTNPVSPSATTPEATAAGGGIVKMTSPTPTPSPSPSPGNCSPGYYKTHAIDSPGNQENVWYGASFGFCDNAGQPSCADLLDDMLNGGGRAANAAADYLNSVTGFVCED